MVRALLSRRAPRSLPSSNPSEKVIVRRSRVYLLTPQTYSVLSYHASIVSSVKRPCHELSEDVRYALDSVPGPASMMAKGVSGVAASSVRGTTGTLSSSSTLVADDDREGATT